MYINVDANSLQYIFERESTKTTTKYHTVVGIIQAALHNLNGTPPKKISIIFLVCVCVCVCVCVSVSGLLSMTELFVGGGVPT